MKGMCNILLISSPSSSHRQATPGLSLHFCSSVPTILDKPAVCADLVYCQMVIFLAVVEFYDM